jgi:O-acetyl-ADP-ribose deacetylase (regulator of RNase III)
MEIKYIKGDLIRDREQYEVIAHQCNCFLSFGAGIAAQIKTDIPEAYQVDLSTQYGDKNKLGTITYTTNSIPIVVNMYGQYKYTRHEIDTNYDALRSCFKLMKQKFSGKKIGLPLIGAGLASGNWETIESIIKEELLDEDVTVVIWEKGNNNPVSI